MLMAFKSLPTNQPWVDVLDLCSPGRMMKHDAHSYTQAKAKALGHNPKTGKIGQGRGREEEKQWERPKNVEEWKEKTPYHK